MGPQVWQGIWPLPIPTCPCLGKALKAYAIALVLLMPCYQDDIYIYVIPDQTYIQVNEKTDKHNTD